MMSWNWKSSRSTKFAHAHWVVGFRTISKWRCRYEMVLIYHPPNELVACADFVDFATQHNGRRGREKDLFRDFRTCRIKELRVSIICRIESSVLLNVHLFPPHVLSLMSCMSPVSHEWGSDLNAWCMTEHLKKKKFRGPGGFCWVLSVCGGMALHHSKMAYMYMYKCIVNYF
jgi:hypothetical protein